MDGLGEPPILQGVGRGHKDEAPPTTTLSTIAVQSGRTRILVALLKSGDALSLRILEMSPELPTLGDTLEDACQLSEAHTMAIAKLQSKQSPVEEMLRQADSMLAGQKPRPEVYSAMAATLGHAWKALNEQLEMRKAILEGNVAFHSRAGQLREGLNDLEKEASSDFPVMRDVEQVRTLLGRLQNARRSCLEASVQAIKQGHALLERLRELRLIGTVDSRPEVLVEQVNTAIAQVERWLESLHDRRLRVDLTWKKRRNLLDQTAAVCVVRRELDELEKLVSQKKQTLLQNDSLGDSQTSAEYHLFEQQKSVPVIKEVREKAVRVTKVAERLQGPPSSGSEEVKTLAYSMLEQCAELQEIFDNRMVLLGLAVQFFRTAQTTITKMDQLDVQLATSTFAPGSVGLGRLHAQVIRAMEEATAPALHYGYDLLEKTGHGNPGSQGITNMVEDIEKRSFNISAACTAHKEEAIRNLERVQMMYEQIDEVYHWLTNVAEGLIRTHADLGVNQNSAGEFLELHKQMLNDVEMKGQEMEIILRQLPAIYESVEEPHSTNLQLKFEHLKDTWHQIKSALDSRVDASQTYHRFHTIAIALKEDLEELEHRARDGADIRESHLAAKQKYLQLDLIGRNFITDIPKIQDLFLDTPKAALCVEALLEHLEKRYSDVTELLNQRESRMHQEKQLQDRWSKITLDIDGISQRIKDITKGVFPVIPSEISTTLVLNKIEDKTTKFSKDVGVLAEELKIKISALDSFSESDDNVRELMNKLSGHNSELSRFSFEISQILQLTVKYYRTLVQIDQTIESLEHQYYTTVLPANVPDIELIIRDHVANYNLLANLIANTKADCDTLITHYRDIPCDTKHDIDVLMHSLDTRSRHWEAVWQERNWRLTQHRQHCQFNADLMNVQNQIDDMMRQLDSIKNAGRYASSLTMCRSNSDAFSQFERSVDTIEPKVQNFLSTAEKIVASENDEDRRQPIDSGIKTVTTKWSSLRTNVGETRNVIEQRTTYFTLVEEVEDWFNHGSRLLVSLARRSTLCRSKSEADDLVHEVQQFVESGKRQQEEKINKISSIAIELQTPEGAKLSENVTREYREVFESFTSITKELVILSKNLQTAEVEKRQAAETEAVFRESLAAAQAEAEAARAAARAAEQARLAAESIALSINSRPKVTIETTQTELKTQCDFGLQVTHITPSKRVRLSDAAIQSDEPPVFTETLHDETVTEGQRITLRCKVTGKPRPEISWYKDGMAIDNNPDYQTSCIDNVCTLHIEETFAEDTAVFFCKAVSFAGSAETSAKLTVRDVLQQEELVAPDFTKPLVNCSAREGGSIQLSCSIVGTPIPSVSWYKNGKCIDSGPEYQIEARADEHVLTIEEVFLEDQGQYICHATNCAGEAESTAMLVVEPLTPSEPPVILTPLSNVMARAGRKFRLEAKISGKPQPSIVWMHNGRPIKETRELKTLTDGTNCTLIVTEAFPKDSGSYTVSAKNIAGEASSTSSVTVKGRLPAENSDTELGLSDVEPTRPKFLVPLKSCMTLEGNKVKLEVLVEGEPDPEITWYRKDVLITENSEYQQIFQGNKSALILRQAHLYDAGSYKVMAINSAGEASSECHLSVEENLQPPKFTKLLGDANVKLNQRVRFEAQVIGKPDPEVTWLKDNLPLARTSRHSIFNLPDGVFVLEIPHADPSYEGVYVIKAHNKAGEAKCIAELSLRGPTPPPPPKLEDLMSPPQFEKLFSDNRVHKGTPVAFQCIISGDPTPIVRWQYQGKPAENHPDIAISDMGGIHTLSIRVAEPHHSGKVVCTAENPAGVASCTAALAVHEPSVVYQSSLNVKRISSQTEVKEKKEVTEMERTTSEIVDAPKLSVKERANIFSSTKVVAVEQPQQRFTKTQQKLIPPKFVQPLRSSQVEEGSRLTMEAVVEGHPPPQISWKHNGQDLLTDDRVKVSLDINRVRLTFSDVILTDVGDYSCVATNKAGIATSTAQLAIRKPLFPPVIGRRIQPMSVKEGERVHLEIEVTGMPAPEVKWFRNGVLIEDPRVAKESEGARYWMTIAKATSCDSGRYRASAENEAGRADSSADVIVHSAIQPLVPTQSVVIENVVYDSRTDTRQFTSSTMTKSSRHISESSGTSLHSRVAEHKKILEAEARSLESLEEPLKILAPKKKSPKREPVSESARKLDEFSKALSPNPVAGGVRLLPTPTEEKSKPPLAEVNVKAQKIVERKEVEFKFEAFKELEPFPFKPEPSRPSAPKGPPPRRPSKFVKGESKESDYESDLDSRFPVKWVPPGSDTEGEPAYQKIKLELKERRKKRREEKQRPPTPPTEFDVPPVIEAPPRPKIDIPATVSALKQVATSDSEGAEKREIRKVVETREVRRTETREGRTLSVETTRKAGKPVSPQRPKPEALEMEKKWLPKKETTDIIIIKEPVVHTEARKSVSPMPSQDALQMEKQWGRKFTDTNVSWPPQGDEAAKSIVPWAKTESQVSTEVKSCSVTSTARTSSSTVRQSSTASQQFSTAEQTQVRQSASSSEQSAMQPVGTKSHDHVGQQMSSSCQQSTTASVDQQNISTNQLSLTSSSSDQSFSDQPKNSADRRLSTSVSETDKKLMFVAVVGQKVIHHIPPEVDLRAVDSAFGDGFLTGLRSTHLTTSSSSHFSSSSTQLTSDRQTNINSVYQTSQTDETQAEKVGKLNSDAETKPVDTPTAVPRLSQHIDLGLVDEMQDIWSADEEAKQHDGFTAVETRSEVVTQSYGKLSTMKAMWESKLHQESQAIEETRVTTKHELVPQRDTALTTELVTAAPPPQGDVPALEPPLTDKVGCFEAFVTHAKPLTLEPFPFTPDPPRPKKSTPKLPPPTRPKKFIKGDFRESDYESDYEGKIRPKWVPSDSETEDLVYRPVRPRLQSRSPSRRRRERSPTPPTVFDTPPTLSGPPRPVIDLDERIVPEGKEAEPVFCPLIQPKEELIVKTIPSTRKPLPTTPTPPVNMFKPITPPSYPPLTPEPAPSECYAPRPLLSTNGRMGVETTQRMKMEESTASSRRFVSMEQTTRVIKLEPPERNRIRREEMRAEAERRHEFDSDSDVEKIRSGRDLVLEPFPFVAEPPRPRALKDTVVPKPKKFVKGESRESDYESDFESVRFRSKWIPAGSDTEEPLYRKVRPPAPVSSEVREKIDRMRRSPTPPPSFDIPPELEGRPRPKITEEDVKNLRELLEQERLVRDQSITPTPPSTLSLRYQLPNTNSEGSSRPVFRAPPPPPEVCLTPGETPEFGYAEKPATTASRMVASQLSNMSDSFRNQMHGFSNQIANDLRLAPPSPPAPQHSPRQVQFQDVPTVQILEASSDAATEDSTEPHAYKEESRVSEFGSKHIDPDTGLIYFKYDFGYEFGIVLPGEPKKVEKIQPETREGDITVPVIHEKSPRRESPLSLRKSPKQSPPSKRSSRCKAPVSESEVSDSEKSKIPTEKMKIPNFKPRKITHAKAARWEPVSESEISEMESTLERRGPSRYYKQRRDAFQRFEGEGGRGDESAVSVSPSVSPYPQAADSIASTPCEPHNQAPRILTSLIDLHVNAGHSVSFECVASGDWLVFCWSKDEREIVPSPDYKIVSKGGASLLTIPEVFPEDSGIYTCTVMNQFGLVSTTATLRVEEEMLWSSRI